VFAKAQLFVLWAITMMFRAHSLLGEEIAMLKAHASRSIPTKIIVPIDFSPSSDNALAVAADLAQHFHSGICLLHVIPMLPIEPEVSFTPEDLYLDGARKHAEQQFSTCVAKLVSEGVAATSLIEIGNDVAGNIMMIIEREHVDMVVLSTHGMSGWRPMVFGSIAQSVVDQVQCPLLLLRSVKPASVSV
jgi:nucleotide-binding universal stress UspA family protein